MSQNTKQNGSGKRFVIRSSFSKAIAAGVEGPFVQRKLGAGMAVSQTGCNLVITSGTTANSETILRLEQPVSADLILKYALNLSQRIAQNNFFLELVDYVAEGAPFVINSATSVSVTLTPDQANRFDAGSVGQTIALGNITGAAGIPMRGTIASVAVNTLGQTILTFTVAGWPASGSGTLDLFGHNAIRLNYDSTVATNVKFDCIRNGYGSGDTTATINTTASLGHSGIVQIEDSFVAYLDRLVASTTAVSVAQRASRVAQTPDPGTEMYLQIRALNGTTNPASTTTLTVNFVGLEDYSPAVVSLQSVRAQGADGALPFRMSGSDLTGTAQLGFQGAVADDGAAASYNPVIVGGKARNANPTAMSATGDAVSAVMTMIGVPVVRQNSIPEAEWQFVTTVTGTSYTAIKAAAAAGIKNYLTGLTYQNTLAVATVFNVLRGTTVIATFSAPASMANPVQVIFPTPLQSAAAEALYVQNVTTGASIIVNAQGYSAP